jgi:hypothetical protein
MILSCRQIHVKDFLCSTQKLGVESKNCLVVEDSVIGLLVSLPTYILLTKLVL